MRLGLGGQRARLHDISKQRSAPLGMRAGVFAITFALSFKWTMQRGQCGRLKKINIQRIPQSGTVFNSEDLFPLRARPKHGQHKVLFSIWCAFLSEKKKRRQDVM